MHLRYYLDEAGNRVYTLKVRRFFCLLCVSAFALASLTASSVRTSVEGLP